jgi:uncharacterized damage-inducible protein DinB
MNRFMQEKWSWIEGSHAMRTSILDTLSDDDLAFNPGGQNMTLGALLREMGEVEYAYLQSLKTYKTDFTYRNSQAYIDRSLDQLRAWYQLLDDEMQAVLSPLADDDFQKPIERASGYSMPMEMQLDVYLQALLIYFGKLTIYLKAMDKTLPPAVKDYIW